MKGIAFILIVFLAGVAAVGAIGQPGFSSSNSTLVKPGWSISDELLNEGTVIWQGYFVVSSLGGLLPAISNFGSCPHYSSVREVNSTTVQIQTAGDTMSIDSTPSTGTVVYTVTSDYVPNTCNAGIRPGMRIVYHYSVPAFKGVISASTPFGSDVTYFSSFGSILVTYQGRTYLGLGTYEHYTARNLSDPRPGYYSQGGWVENNLYVLHVGVLQGYQFSQIYWRSLGVFEPAVLSVSGECPDFVYAVHTPQGSFTITISHVTFAEGTCSYGNGFATASSTLGGQAVAFVNTDQ